MPPSDSCSGQASQKPCAGIAALRALKQSAREHDLGVEEEKAATARRAEDAVAGVQKARDRDRRLGELRGVFVQLTDLNDRQARGYGLEDLLKKLFSLNEIRYRKSYRAEGEQIDGFFNFGGFDYLVEARWRAEQPTFGDLAEFKAKVDGKIESTRGMWFPCSDFGTT